VSVSVEVGHWAAAQKGVPVKKRHEKKKTGVGGGELATKFSLEQNGKGGKNHGAGFVDERWGGGIRENTGAKVDHRGERDPKKTGQREVQKAGKKKGNKQPRHMRIWEGRAKERGKKNS